eukprot:14701626-Alexandrium_andersonii.AAC.1
MALLGAGHLRLRHGADLRGTPPPAWRPRAGPYVDLAVISGERAPPKPSAPLALSAPLCLWARECPALRLCSGPV